MGARKRKKAEEAKEIRKNQYFASLRNCPTSPRKMRLVTDLVRGMEINKAFNVLKYSSKEASGRVEKLLRSAVANWESKNEGTSLEDSDLFISEIFVDSGRVLKRLRPAPQGRAHRIRKRSNHVTLFVDNRVSNDVEVESDNE